MPTTFPSYRLHKPSSQAVVTLNGHDFYLGPWKSAASRLEYDRLIAEWVSNGRQLPSVVACGALSVAELLVAYLRFAKEYYSCDGRPTSEYTSMKDAIRPVRDLYARIAVQDFGPLALKAVRQRMVDRGLSRRHINQRINRVRRVFKWGVENELVPSSILHGLQAVAALKQGRTTAPESNPVKPVPEADVQAVLALVSRQVAAMIQLQLLAGMRPGEVVIMRPCDVDRSGSVWIYRPGKHKTAYRGHEREIYLGPRAQEVLMPWLLREAEAFCFSPREAEDERNALRRQSRQTPMTPSHARRKPKQQPKRPKRDRYDRDSYRRAIDYALAKAEVPHWHPHQLRHSCGTRIRKEYGLDVVQVVLGHKSAMVTEVYAEVDRAKAVAVMAAVG
ncbi:MAG TPA: site-specific integrase [Pirellulales bacterium]|jgi:integrase|nr:site-specific integrase [Pirellulales bacterium]